jgi:hypothetical protein
MKLFVDDVRFPPEENWMLARTYRDAIYYLKTGAVRVLSLDHDLGDASRSGYDIAMYMLAHKIWPDKIYVHSYNPVGASNIMQLLEGKAPEGTEVARVRLVTKGDITNWQDALRSS